MAGTAEEQRDASGLWSEEDLALVVGSQPYGVRGCVRVLKSTSAGTSSEHAWVRGVHGGQTQSGSAAWLGWLASARGHASMHENGCASSRTTRCSHHPGGKAPRRAAPWLAAAECQRAWLGRGT
jgi:hypothetical protein